MNKFSQSGKGLSGFFFGLILATVIIAGILFYLNQTGQNAFKNPFLSKQPAETEILKPKNQPEEDLQPDPTDHNVLTEPDGAKTMESTDGEKPSINRLLPIKSLRLLNKQTSRNRKSRKSGIYARKQGSRKSM